MRRKPAPQEHPIFGQASAGALLCELYRRHRARADYESLCREIGPQQGWPYEELVNLDREQEDWQQVLAWADDGLAQELAGAPAIIRERGDLLEAVARPLAADDLFDGAVHLYERLVERGADGRNRATYELAGTFCRVIRSIRRLQGRVAAFDRYYQELFLTYRRLSALKDELRKAIEGPRGRRQG